MRSQLSMSPLGIAASLLVLAASASAADLNVTNDPSHVWGAPILAVNPKDPNNIVLASVGIAFTKECAAKAATDPQSPCADVKVIPRGNITTRPYGMMNNVSGFVEVAAWATFDGGKTWNRTAEIKQDGNVPVFPPDKYQGSGMSDANGLSVRPDGTFYMAWDAVHFDDVPLYGSFGGIPFSKSTDGGRTWSKPALTGSALDGGRLFTDPNTGVIYTTSTGPLGPGPMSLSDPKVRVSKETGATNMARHMLTSKDGVNWGKPQTIGGGGGSITAAHGLLATAFKTTADENYLDAAGRSVPNNELCGTTPTPCTVFQTTKDGGATWSRTVLSVPNTYSGQPLVAADPTKPEHYALAVLMDANTGMHVYRTEDGGKTWKGPTKISGEPGKVLTNASMAYGPKGDLGLVWKGRSAASQTVQGFGQGGLGTPRTPFNIFAAVSKDGGTAFSQPMKINSGESPAPPGDRQFALSRDNSISIALTGEYVLLAWPDWRTEEASLMFSAVKLAAFK